MYRICLPKYRRGRKGKHKCWKQSLDRAAAPQLMIAASSGALSRRVSDNIWQRLRQQQQQQQQQHTRFPQCSSPGLQMTVLKVQSTAPFPTDVPSSTPEAPGSGSVSPDWNLKKARERTSPENTKRTEKDTQSQKKSSNERKHIDKPMTRRKNTTRMGVPDVVLLTNDDKNENNHHHHHHIMFIIIMCTYHYILVLLLHKKLAAAGGGRRSFKPPKKPTKEIVS